MAPLCPKSLKTLSFVTQNFLFYLISALRLKVYFEIQKLEGDFVLSPSLLSPLRHKVSKNRTSYYCQVGLKITENIGERKTQINSFNGMELPHSDDADNCLPRESTADLNRKGNI